MCIVFFGLASVIYSFLKYISYFMCTNKLPAFTLCLSSDLHSNQFWGFLYFSWYLAFFSPRQNWRLTIYYFVFKNYIIIEHVAYMKLLTISMDLFIMSPISLKDFPNRKRLTTVFLLPLFLYCSAPYLFKSDTLYHIWIEIHCSTSLHKRNRVGLNGSQWVHGLSI